MKLNKKMLNFMNHISVRILKFQKQLMTQQAHDTGRLELSMFTVSEGIFEGVFSRCLYMFQMFISRKQVRVTNTPLHPTFIY